MTTDKHAVSAERRAALVEQLGMPSVSNFFPIERYYDAATKTFNEFQNTYAKKDVDTCYLMGKRYCHFCLDVIPQHNYFNQRRQLAVKHRKQVDKVLIQLETVVTWMDALEVERKRREAEETKRRQQLFLEETKRKAKKIQQAEAARLEDIKRRAADMGPVRKSQDAASVQSSALQKLQMLKQASAPDLEHARIKKDPSGERSTTRFRLEDDSDTEDDDGEQQSILPPPLPIPSASDSALPPPSYTEVVGLNAPSRPLPIPPPNDDFLNGSKFMMPESDSGLREQDGLKPKRPAKRKSMRALREEYYDMYSRLRKNGSIRVQTLPTYQGRISGSTNGCTVISALVAGHHLNIAGGISNDDIRAVIDRDCIPVLKTVRGKLGLGGHALIIPSDVHDYLVDQKLLKQEYFTGVAGGNVMDTQHLGEFVKLVEGSKTGAKTSATFFFKEHVISVCKTVNGGRPEFHLVDSLPSAQNGVSAGTRTMCADIEAFRVLMNYYCSRKFSSSDCDRLDKTSWDDGMADFDPRVFQGFVWEAPV